jgi:hypothetical protein
VTLERASSVAGAEDVVLATGFRKKMIDKSVDQIRLSPSGVWTARLIAIGYTLGSLEHATGLVLLAFGIEMYSHYPAWRHAAFVGIDAFIAWVAVRRPDWLFFFLLAFLIEQIITNGRLALREWTDHRHVLWMVVAMHILIFLATVAAGFLRWSRSTSELSQSN